METNSNNKPKNGLEALLRPEDSILVLIDHQPISLPICTATSRR